MRSQSEKPLTAGESACLDGPDLGSLVDRVGILIRQKITPVPY